MNHNYHEGIPCGPSDPAMATHSGLTTGIVQEAARAAKEKLPPTHGIILIILPYGEGDDRKADYISTIRREDAIKSLKEILFRWGINEEWMKQAK